MATNENAQQVSPATAAAAAKVETVKTVTYKDVNPSASAHYARLVELITKHNIDPYPHVSNIIHGHTRTPIPEVIGIAEQKCAPCECIASTGPIRIAGRVAYIRAHGKIMFMHIVDEFVLFGTTKEQRRPLQLFINEAELGKAHYDKVKHTIRNHDVVAVSGNVGRAKNGTPSLFVLDIELLSPCLRIVPEILTDAEIRYRDRPLDLVVNTCGIRTLQQREIITCVVEKHWRDRGLLRIETPILDMLSSGASARPFVSHHNALDTEVHLRIATELPLKKAIAAGAYGGTFEIGKQFRNEDMDQVHNPEFTTCEAYWTYHDYEDLMVTTEELFETLLVETNPETYNKETQILSLARGRRRDGTMGPVDICMKRPWKRVHIVDALHEAIRKAGYTGNLPTDEEMSAACTGDQVAERLLDDICNTYNVECGAPRTIERLFDKLVGHFVEPDLLDPAFLCCHPRFTCPLAKWHRERPALTERFELFIAGTEYSNAYTELNHAGVQRDEFARQLQQKAKGDVEAQDIDEEFCGALELGLPPTAGWGLGIDRTTMLLCGLSNIRDSTFFSLMRPWIQQKHEQLKSSSSSSLVKKKKKETCGPVAIFGSGMMVGAIVNNLAKRTPTRKIDVYAVDMAPSAQKAMTAASVGGMVAFHTTDVLSKDADTIIVNAANTATTVVSMLPPPLHWTVASGCARAGVANMVTSSYERNVKASFDKVARDANIAILNEVGLDPGIDHSLVGAVKRCIAAMPGRHRIVEFVSACGGIPHPDCAKDAPLQYRISWSPGAVLRVMANEARYLRDGAVVTAAPCVGVEHVVKMTIAGTDYEMYPNRDSTEYVDDYGLRGVSSLVRGTLRWPGFCAQARELLDLGVVDDVSIPSNITLVREATIWAMMRKGVDVGAIPDAELTVLHPILFEMGLMENIPIPHATMSAPTIVEMSAMQMAARAQYGPGMRDRAVMAVQAIHINEDTGERWMTRCGMVTDGEPNGSTAMATCVAAGVVAGVEALEAGEITRKGCIRLSSEEEHSMFIERVKTMGVSGFYEETTKL